MDSSGWKRVFLGNAMDVDIDASSRVLIAPELRSAAGLVRDVMLLGMGSHFELWDAQRHAAHEAEVMQSPMPDSLKNFSFSRPGFPRSAPFTASPARNAPTIPGSSTLWARRAAKARMRNFSF